MIWFTFGLLRLYISKNNELNIDTISGDNSFSRVKVYKGVVPEMTEESNISLEKLRAGQFVIAMYDCDWFVAMR